MLRSIGKQSGESVESVLKLKMDMDWANPLVGLGRNVYHTLRVWFGWDQHLVGQVERWIVKS